MCKHYKHLTQDERYYIQRRIASLDDVYEIAEELRVHISTVYREIARNKNEYGQYHCGTAQVKADTRKRAASSKKCFAKFTKKIVAYIIHSLKNSWSPEQISGRMKIDKKVSISHETIYQYIWHDKANGGTLYKLLPHQGKKYKYGDSSRTKIPNRVDISKRPKIVEQKARIGDFEGDTIVGVRGGSKNCLVTLVDRKSKFTLIKRTADKSAQSVQNTIEDIYSSTTLPFKTITFDNGTEFCNHQEIAQNIGCSIYFATPYRSCERALNEHTNGLIRRFFPKKTDFSQISDDEILTVQTSLNNRPRKILGFLTPNEVMNKHLNRIYHKPKFFALHA